MLCRWLPQLQQQAHAEQVTHLDDGLPAAPATLGLDVELPEQVQALQHLGNPEVLRHAIPVYLTDAPQRLVTIRQAMTSGDVSALKEAAHSLKGSSATLGFISLAACCQDLEALGRTRALDQAAPLLAKVEAEYGTVQRVLAIVLNEAVERCPSA
jgi:two-component system, sensor histidine kinase and response regulator